MYTHTYVRSSVCRMQTTSSGWRLICNMLHHHQHPSFPLSIRWYMYVYVYVHVRTCMDVYVYVCICLCVSMSKHRSTSLQIKFATSNQARLSILPRKSTASILASTSMSTSTSTPTSFSSPPSWFLPIIQHGNFSETLPIPVSYVPSPDPVVFGERPV